MNDKCELAGMIWHPRAHHTVIKCDKNPEYNRYCTWCNKLVCINHSYRLHSIAACDECVVLDKKIVVKGEVKYARNCGEFIPTDKSLPYFAQYSGMHTKSAL